MYKFLIACVAVFVALATTSQAEACCRVHRHRVCHVTSCSPCCQPAPQAPAAQSPAPKVQTPATGGCNGGGCDGGGCRVGFFGRLFGRG